MEDVIPDIYYTHGSTIWCIGWSEIQVEPTNQDKTLTEHLHNDDSDSTWATSFIHMDNDEKYISEYIKQETAIAVSNGSYDNGISAALCTIEGESPFWNRITATASSPGSSITHDAYRGELTGLIAIVKIIEGLCHYHKVEKGKITIACNVINAIKKAMDMNITVDCQSSNFNLISAINKKL
eukprot:986861-Ditylum_brightwellii.AAC.1